MRVSGPDLRQIVHFLDAALAAESTEPFPRSTLTALTDVIPADQADYFEVRSDRIVISFSTAFNEDPGWCTDEVVARTAKLNPLGPFKWGPAHGPLRMSEIFSELRLHRMEYYRDFLRPAGIQDRLRVWLWQSPESAACVTLIRSDANFSTRDTAVLAVLQPHLEALRERARSAPDFRDEAELTIRESQVMTMAATGRTNAEIGRLLFMSTATVAKHLEHAYRKLHVVGRSEVAASLRAGIAEATPSWPLDNDVAKVARRAGLHRS